MSLNKFIPLEKLIEYCDTQLCNSLDKLISLKLDITVIEYILDRLLI